MVAFGGAGSRISSLAIRIGFQYNRIYAFPNSITFDILKLVTICGAKHITAYMTAFHACRAITRCRPVMAGGGKLFAADGAGGVGGAVGVGVAGVNAGSAAGTGSGDRVPLTIAVLAGVVAGYAAGAGSVVPEAVAGRAGVVAGLAAGLALAIFIPAGIHCAALMDALQAAGAGSGGGIPRAVFALAGMVAGNGAGDIYIPAQINSFFRAFAI